MIKSSTKGSRTHRILLSTLCIVAPCTLGCGAAETYEPITCGTITDCRNAPNAPRCADLITCKCNNAASPPECIYRLKITTTECLCIEGDVRVCDLPGGSGAQGIRVCETYGSTGTRWSATCEPLSSPP